MVYKQTDFQSNNLSSIMSEVYYESTHPDQIPESMVANDSIENLSDSERTDDSNRLDMHGKQPT